MDVEPVDAFPHLNLDHGLADEVFFVARFRLADLKAQVQEVHPVFVKPGEGFRLGYGDAESLHGKAKLLEGMEEVLLGFCLA